MYVRKDASKMVIQYNYRLQTEMFRSSLSDDRRACPTIGGPARLNA